MTLRSFDTGQPCTDLLIVYSRESTGLSPRADVDPSDRINRHRNRANFATYRPRAWSVLRVSSGGFFARYIIYQLSTRRGWPALSLLRGGSLRSLRARARARETTYHNLSVHVMEPNLRQRGVSIYHYPETKPSPSRLQSPFSSRLLHRRAKKKKALSPVSQASISLLAFDIFRARNVCCRL